MSASHYTQQSSYDPYRRRQADTIFQSTAPARNYLSTPSYDDPRPVLHNSTYQHSTELSNHNYQLPRPFSSANDDRGMSTGTQPFQGHHSTAMNPQVDARRGSFDPNMFMIPQYMPMYQHPAQHEQWQAMMHQQGMQWPYGTPFAMPNYGMVQRPLPPGPVGPVEKPRRRRAPPTPQYLHMTVAEMIEELAYREIDTSALQARKAKKAEYIDQLQRADRNGNTGRGAWKSCHGNVPPIDKPEKQI